MPPAARAMSPARFLGAADDPALPPGVLRPGVTAHVDLRLATLAVVTSGVGASLPCTATCKCCAIALESCDAAPLPRGGLSTSRVMGALLLEAGRGGEPGVGTSLPSSMVSALGLVLAPGRGSVASGNVGLFIPVLSSDVPYTDPERPLGLFTRVFPRAALVLVCAANILIAVTRRRGAVGRRAALIE